MRFGWRQSSLNQPLGDRPLKLLFPSAERLLTERWLATQPEQVILALAQLTRTAQDENASTNDHDEPCRLPHIRLNISIS
jgi:hypothetical protein